MNDIQRRALKSILGTMLEKVDNVSNIQYRDIQTLINMNSRWGVSEIKKENKNKNKNKEDIER